MSRSPHYQLRSQLSSSCDPNSVSSLVAIPHVHSVPWISSEGQADNRLNHLAHPEPDHQRTRSISNRIVKATSSNRLEKSFRNGLNQGKMDTAKGTTWDSPTLPYLGASAPSSPALSASSSAHPDSPEGMVLQTHLSRLGPKLRMGKRPPWESPSLDEYTDEQTSLVSHTRDVSADEYGYTSRPGDSSFSSYNGLDGGKDRYLAAGSLRGSNGGAQTLKTLGGRLLRKVRSHAELGGGENQRRGTQHSGGRNTPCFVESTDSLLGAESDGTQESDTPITPIDGQPIKYEDKTPMNQSASQFVATPPDGLYAGAHRTQPDGQYSAGQNIQDAGWPITPGSNHLPTAASYSHQPVQIAPPDAQAFTQPFKVIGSGLGLISLQEAQAREESSKAAAVSRLQQGGSVNSRKPSPAPPVEEARPLSHISEISSASAYSNFTSNSLTSKGNRRLGAAVPPIPPLWMNTLSEMTSPASKKVVQLEQPQSQQSQSVRMAGFKRQKSGLLRMFEKVSSPALGSSGRGTFGGRASPSSVVDLTDGSRMRKPSDEASICLGSPMMGSQPDRPVSRAPHSPLPESGHFPVSPLPPLPQSTHRQATNVSPEQPVSQPMLPEETSAYDEEAYGTSTPPLSSSTVRAPFSTATPTATQSESPITRSSLSVASIAPPNLELRPISMDFLSGLPATYLTEPAGENVTTTTSMLGFLPDIKTSPVILDLALGTHLTETSSSNENAEDMVKQKKVDSDEITPSIGADVSSSTKTKSLEDQLVEERNQWKLQASEFENQIKELQAALAANETRCAVCKGPIERISIAPTIAPTPTPGPAPEPELTFRKQISNMDEGWRVVSGGPIGGGDSVLNRGRMIKPAR